MKITSIIGASNHSGKKESITLFNGSSLLVDKEEKSDEKLAFNLTIPALKSTIGRQDI